MQLTKPIRWGIIGVGNVTEVKSAPAYQKTEGFEISAVMRRNKEKLIDYAKRHNIQKWYTDADQLIHDPEVDAVYIATPPDSHCYYGLKVADAGKPCCIEKPLTPSYQDSKKVVQAFQEKNISLFVAYYRRSLPRFEQIRQWLAEEKIGKVRHIHWHLSRSPKPIDLTNHKNWRTNAEVAPGGYFDDLASHGLDLFAHYFGNYKEVHGISTNQQQLYSAKDALAASWVHKNGITGTGLWNFGSFINRDQVEILGSKGSIQFSMFWENPSILNVNGNIEEHFIKHPQHVQQYHVENIKKHLLGEVKHPSTGISGLHTSWVMDRILGNI
ncbi:Gfo/Idh/MocA family oxidoreductase [Aquimarina sp. ERC-38]|nr:Gfo/Idh/MocA family oxidoreductase [Aquimarina sp. ERC-38]